MEQTTIFSFIVILHEIFGLWFSLYLEFLGSCLTRWRTSTCWSGGFVGHQSMDVCNAIPLCLTWCIWKEHNSRSFEGMESLLLQQKSFFIRSPYDWLKSIGVINGSFFQSSCFFVNFTSLLRAHTEPRGVENFDRILTYRNSNHLFRSQINVLNP